MLAAVIQARMGSTRLPGKTLADIGGKPMLERLVDRVKACPAVEKVIVATTVSTKDDVLAEFCSKKGWSLYRGAELDVLDRVYQAARRFGVQHVVRVTPDCPLLDPEILGRVLKLYQERSLDYVSNTQGCRFPDGLDVEIFSFRALETAWRNASDPSEREHVTAFLVKRPEQFRTGTLEAPEDCSRLKWSVDSAADLDFVRRVYSHLESNGKPFLMGDILKLLNDHPELRRDEVTSVVNEGYYRSLAADSAVPPRKLVLDRSHQLLESARRLIPGGSQTFSKGPTQFVQGASPGFLARGQGCRVWDVDGNDYLDTAMALGSVILGYAHPKVDEAVSAQMKDGVNFSLPHPLEVDLSERLSRIIPCAEMVRFAKNGSDATSGAVRLARAFTGREKIACCGYHGWQDWYIGTTSRRRGVPAAVQGLTRTFEYNRIETLERLFQENRGEIAAVILEPVGIVEPQGDFLRQVQAITQREGALLIFDEVLTGFRISLGGAQAHFGVTPDLACFGKALANGFPLSVVVGRRDVMKLFEEVFFSFTFGGETASLAAAMATLDVLEKEKVIPRLWSLGRELRDGYNVLARHYGLQGKTSCDGLPPRTVVQFSGPEQESLLLKSFFQQECLKRGLLFSGSQNPSFSHGNVEIEEILRVYRSVLEELSNALQAGPLADRLEGGLLQPVFRRA